MRVLVLGGGGREHALVHALSQDPDVAAIVCAPGNAGTAALAEPVAVDPADLAAVRSLAERVDYTIVGPEAPLVAGVVDVLRGAGHQVFGPSRAAARLEGSKAFAKDVMAAAGVPTAAAVATRDLPTALVALDRFGAPWVVKEDGLAAGKGVTVTADRAAAEAAVRAALRIGPVVIEEYLDGPEVSLFVVVTEDGAVVPLLPAADHKRVGDGDTGPNTGGMGAYAPAGPAAEGVVHGVVADVVRPTVAELARRGAPFSGLLFVGLALTAGGPRVVEFNVRFGDPETQAVLALLRTPLTRLLQGTEPPRWRAGAAVSVVVAAAGYPGPVQLGDDIVGLDRVPAPAYVLHAGTRRAPGGRVLTAGGRVLSVTAVGSDLADARDCAYAGVAALAIRGAHFRTDIGGRPAKTGVRRGL